MLWVTDIKIANRESFGGVFQSSIVLPSKIARIKSLVVYAILDDTTILKQAEELINNELLKRKVLRGVISPQIATLSMTLNNTQVIAANTPVCDIHNLDDKTFSVNKVQMQESVNVPQGSVMNILVEEKMNTPFVDKNYIKQITNKGKTNNPYPNVEYTNSYTIKICVEYDK